MNSRAQHAWVLFDADNTLWSVEPLYDQARSEMCQFLAAAGISPVSAEQFQQARDKELYQTYGYSACRFARSFEDTVLHFLPSADPKAIRHVRAIALEVFEQPAFPAEGLEPLLESLAPFFQLGIITAGERWVQERRLQQFHLRHFFQAIEIVETKDASVFTAFVEKQQVDAANSWVIGDSVKSDVLPALDAGLNAILLDAHNWVHVERVELPEHLTVPVIKQIGDAGNVILLARASSR